MIKYTVNNRENFLKVLSLNLPRHSVGVEIGVLRGDFSKQILDTINPNHLILIDPYEVGGELYNSGLSTAYSTKGDYGLINHKFRNEIETGQVMVRKKYSHEIVGRYPDNTIDFVYHDASHLYADVKRDLNQWLPKLKETGLMCGHDMIEVDNFGVIQAVNEFMEEQGFEMIIFNNDGGDWALKRKQQ